MRERWTAAWPWLAWGWLLMTGVVAVRLDGRGPIELAGALCVARGLGCLVGDDPTAPTLRRLQLAAWALAAVSALQLVPQVPPQWPRLLTWLLAMVGLWRFAAVLALDERLREPGRADWRLVLRLAAACSVLGLAAAGVALADELGWVELLESDPAFGFVPKGGGGTLALLAVAVPAVALLAALVRAGRRTGAEWEDDAPARAVQ